MPQRLGQHFLVSETILDKIAAAACGDHVHRVIEIGSGRGALTRHLLPRTDELHGIELDFALVEFLQRKFGGGKLLVHHADVLETDLAAWGPAVIAGNLPYYITSPIIERFVQLGTGFPTAVFLIQAEVAERLIATPGTRDYGYLTVATGLMCSVEIVCRVPPSAFRPPPKVESAAVRLVRKDAVPENRERILRLASRAFAHKRKTLRNNLRPFYGPVVDGLPQAGLRAEQLSLDMFVDLDRRLS